MLAKVLSDDLTLNILRHVVRVARTSISMPLHGDLRIFDRVCSMNDQRAELFLEHCSTACITLARHRLEDQPVAIDENSTESNRPTPHLRIPLPVQPNEPIFVWLQLAHLAQTVTYRFGIAHCVVRLSEYERFIVHRLQRRHSEAANGGTKLHDGCPGDGSDEVTVCNTGVLATSPSKLLAELLLHPFETRARNHESSAGELEVILDLHDPSEQHVPFLQLRGSRDLSDMDTVTRHEIVQIDAATELHGFYLE